jgi:aspartate carbamoyltransferase catalytic subunit
LGFFDHITLKLISPKSLALPDSFQSLASDSGITLIESESLEEISGADVIYMTRIQEERFSSRETYLQYAGRLSLDLETFERHGKCEAIIMHPLPRDSRLVNKELADDLEGLPNLAVFRQAHNGVPLRMALFLRALGLEGNFAA